MTTTQTETRWPRPKWPTIIVTSSVALAVGIWGVINPEHAGATFTAAANWVAENLGWYYLATAVSVFLFVIWLAISRYGKVKLGPDSSKPKYSLFTWASMLFATGIGIDVMFYAVAEPVAQYYAPPALTPETAEAAHNAVVWGIFHYGLIGWCMYGLVGLAFALYSHRYGAPLSFRSILLPVMRKLPRPFFSETINVGAILGTLFGFGVMLGVGVVQLSYGLDLVFGIGSGLAVQIVLVSFVVLVTAVSTVSGVDKGIKWLSQINVVLIIIFTIYIVATGNTVFVLNALVTDAGTFVNNFVDMATNMHPYGDVLEWMGAWTLFFWAWWIAVTPIVGVFLARISRGRTIRQLIVGCLSLPFLFIFLFMSIFGHSGLAAVTGGNGEFGNLVLENPEAGFYSLMEQFPLGQLLIVAAVLIGLLLYITSADSGALMQATLSSHTKTAEDDGGPRLRVYFAALGAFLTTGLLVAGGLEVVQGATLILGLPFSVMMYFIMIGLVKALRAEANGTPLKIFDLDRQSREPKVPKDMSHPAVEKASSDSSQSGADSTEDAAR